MSARELERLHRYLEALDQAGTAIETARRLRPQPGLDHAIERLRWLLLDGSRELLQAEHVVDTSDPHR